MKKNLKKKALIPAIAMVLASVIALSGVTYAWFTVGNTANVNSLDVNVKTANGIQISLDAKTWKSSIDSSDIIDAIGGISYTSKAVQFPDGEILPVSSNGKVVNGRLQMFNGEYNTDGTLKSAEAEDVNGREVAENIPANYVAFDLFFKTSSQKEQPLSLLLNDSTVTCTNAFNGDMNANTDTAVRVAFLDLGRVDGTGEAAAATVRTLTGDSSTKALIWEPSALKTADGSARIERESYKGFNTSFAGIREDDLNTAKVDADGNKTDSEDATAAVVDVEKNAEIFTATKELTSLKSGISKVRVYIWLEGQDVDCVNTISFGDFSTNLVFAVPEEAAEETTVAPEAPEEGG